MCHGVFSAVIHGAGIGDEGFVVFKVGFHGAGAGFQTAFHDGHVASVIDFFFPVFLEAHGYFFVFGEEHEAGGVAVEAVDGMGAAALLSCREVLVEDALGGFLFFAGAVGEQAFLFVDDHEVFVFIDDGEPFVVEAFFGGGLPYFDGHAGFQLEVELAGAFAVNAYGAVGEPAFHFGAADAVQFVHDELHEFGGFGNLQFEGVAFGVGFSFRITIHNMFNNAAKIRFFPEVTISQITEFSEIPFKL